MAALEGCSKPTRAFIVSGTTMNRRPQMARGGDYGRRCHAAQVRAKLVGRFWPDLVYISIYYIFGGVVEIETIEIEYIKYRIDIGLDSLSQGSI